MLTQITGGGLTLRLEEVENLFTRLIIGLGQDDDLVGQFSDNSTSNKEGEGALGGCPGGQFSPTRRAQWFPSQSLFDLLGGGPDVIGKCWSKGLFRQNRSLLDNAPLPKMFHYKVKETGIGQSLLNALPEILQVESRQIGILPVVSPHQAGSPGEQPLPPCRCGQMTAKFTGDPFGEKFLYDFIDFPVRKPQAQFQSGKLNQGITLRAEVRRTDKSPGDSALCRRNRTCSSLRNRRRLASASRTSAPPTVASPDQSRRTT